MPHLDQNPDLQGMSGQELYSAYEGLCRRFHEQMISIRNAYARLPVDDEWRNTGLVFTMLWDIRYHHTEEEIGHMATALTSAYNHTPIFLIGPDDDEGQIETTIPFSNEP